MENGKQDKSKANKRQGKIEFPRRNAFMSRRVVSLPECRMSRYAFQREAFFIYGN